MTGSVSPTKRPPHSLLPLGEQQRQRHDVCVHTAAAHVSYEHIQRLKHSVDQQSRAAESLTAQLSWVLKQQHVEAGVRCSYS